MLFPWPTTIARADGRSDSDFRLPERTADGGPYRLGHPDPPVGQRLGEPLPKQDIILSGTRSLASWWGQRMYGAQKQSTPLSWQNSGVLSLVRKHHQWGMRT